MRISNLTRSLVLATAALLVVEGAIIDRHHAPEEGEEYGEALKLLVRSNDSETKDGPCACPAWAPFYSPETSKCKSSPNTSEETEYEACEKQSTPSPSSPPSSPSSTSSTASTTIATSPNHVSHAPTYTSSPRTATFAGRRGLFGGRRFFGKRQAEATAPDPTPADAAPLADPSPTTTSNTPSVYTTSANPVPPDHPSSGLKTLPTSTQDAFQTTAQPSGEVSTTTVTEEFGGKETTTVTEEKAQETTTVTENAGVQEATTTQTETEVETATITSTVTAVETTTAMETMTDGEGGEGSVAPAERTAAPTAAEGRGSRSEFVTRTGEGRETAMAEPTWRETATQSQSQASEGSQTVSASTTGDTASPSPSATPAGPSSTDSPSSDAASSATTDTPTSTAPTSTESDSVSETQGSSTRSFPTLGLLARRRVRQRSARKPFKAIRAVEDATPSADQTRSSTATPPVTTLSPTSSPSPSTRSSAGDQEVSSTIFVTASGAAATNVSRAEGRRIRRGTGKGRSCKRRVTREEEEEEEL